MRRICFALLISSSFAQEEGPTLPNTTVLGWARNSRELVDSTEEHARAGRFDRAVEILARALRDDPAAVVPVEPGRAEGVRAFVEKKIISWGAPGVEAYRRRFEADAEEERKRAGSAEELREVARRYPFCDAGERAAAAAAARFAEAGRKEEAAGVLREMFRRNPFARSPVAIALAAGLFAETGRFREGRALRKRCREETIESPLRRGGTRVELSRILDEAEHRETAPPAASAFDPDWPAFGGDAGGARAFGQDLRPTPSSAWNGDLPEPAYGEDDRWGGEVRLAASVFPAVVDGVLYAANGVSVRAWNLMTGAEPVKLWGIGPVRPPAALVFEERIAHSVTVHAGRVYASLVSTILAGESRLSYLQVTYPLPKRSLLCLDADTGRLLWKIGGGDPSARLSGLSFPAAPAAADGRLYVAATEQMHGTDPFRHYLLCLDAATGDVRWKTFVASGGTEINLFGNSIRESVPSRVSLRDGRVFVCTNHGAIACLDANTGEIEWVVRYEQIPVRPTRQFPPPRNQTFFSNNPIVADEAVVVAPLDSKRILALRPEDGATLWSLAFDDVRASSVLGVRGRALVLAGEDVWLVHVETGKRLARIPTDRGTGSLRGWGRGALGDRWAYVPTRYGLSILDLEGRREHDFLPWNATRPFNVTLAENLVVLTEGEDSIRLWREELGGAGIASADPVRNPTPAFRAALRLLQAGRREEAIQRLKVLARGTDGRIAGASRRRLFRLMREEAKEARLRGGPEGWKIAEAALREAESLAVGPEEELELVLDRESLAIARGDPAARIEAAQRLLERFPDAWVDERSAADHAFESIAEAIRSGGRENYARFDRAAEKLLEEARRHASVQEMLAVYLRYPNSTAAPAALRAAAEGLLAGGRRAEALRWLFLARAKYPAADGRRIDALIVSALEKSLRFESARRFLERLRNEAGEESVEWEGKRKRVKEWVDEKLASPAYAPRPPAPPPAFAKDAEIRLRHRPDPPWEAQAPIHGAPDERAEGVVPITLPMSLLLVDTGTGRELSSVPLPAPALALHWCGAVLAVQGERYVLGVDPRSGRGLWRAEPASPITRAAADAECFYFTSPDSEGTGLTVHSVHAGTGEELWRTSLPGACEGLQPTRTGLMVLTTAPSAVVRLNLESGAREKTLRLDSVYRRSLVPAEGMILLRGERGFQAELAAYDEDLSLRWERRLAPGTRVLAGPEWIVAGSPGGVEWISRRTGKLCHDVRLSGGSEGRPAAFCCVSAGDRVYVGLEAAVVCYDKGERLWSATIGGVTVRDLAADGKHLIVLDSIADGGRYAYRVTMLDPEGKKVREISGDPRYERPCQLGLWRGILWVNAGGGVEIYR